MAPTCLEGRVLIQPNGLSRQGSGSSFTYSSRSSAA